MLLRIFASGTDLPRPNRVTHVSLVLCDVLLKLKCEDFAHIQATQGKALGCPRDEYLPRFIDQVRCLNKLLHFLGRRLEEVTQLQKGCYQAANHRKPSNTQNDWMSCPINTESISRPLKKWASNASGTLFSKKRVAQTRLRSDCTGQSGLFAGHLAHFGRTYPRAHA